MGSQKDVLWYQVGEAIMNPSMIIQNQLLATKFFVPVASHPLIHRTHLSTLLQESLRYPLMLISAPAGFGKTMLLSDWVQSLPVRDPLVAWLSLDEEDNEPRLFWTYVLSALDMHQPERFTSLLKYLQSPQAPPLKYVLTALTNLLVDSPDHYLLILDDYHMITEEQVHLDLSYLVEHLPPQLHLILATRADPPLPLSLLRARGQILEVRTDQLRCTAMETRAFFHKVMGMQFSDETIQEVTIRTEGWLVGLQLLGLSLQGNVNPVNLLEEASGNQRYILDYLIDEVLWRQSQEVQTFLLSTSILERLNASLCDAVMGQAGSQQLLEQLEQVNLFIVSLDSRRQWYRYHALFAEALRCRLEQMQGNLVPTLHHRASLWYAEHDQITQAILHAFSAQEWQWAADLIERIPLTSFTWEAGEHELIRLRHWLERLPAHFVHSRPRLCLACTHTLWSVVPYFMVQTWLDAAEAALTASLTTQADEDASHSVLTSQVRQEQEDLLGDVNACRAFLKSFKEEDGQGVLALCQQAFSLLSAENLTSRALIYWVLLRTYYISSPNDAVTAIQSGLQGGFLAQTAGHTALAITIMGTTACFVIGTGKLYEAQQMTEQAMQLGMQPRELVLPEVGWPMAFQAEILREWNKLDAALSLVQEAISLCKQSESVGALTYLLCGYAMQLRISLSRGDLDMARFALQQVERIGRRMNQNQPWYIYLHSLFTMVDQVRFWLACGELEQATCWAEELDLAERQGSPFVREREEVACVRVLLAMTHPTAALERLEPVLQRATAGQRWGHVIEIRQLQALAHLMCHEETQALDVLCEAVRLAEPEGYIRCFVDEGASMAALLSRLREKQRPSGKTPYLDTVLAAFSQQNKNI
jgi:LuxR family maltose regulon positive regulatory protein